MNKHDQENKTKNPLEELFEDESHISEWGDTTLKALIKPYAYLGNTTKKIFFRDVAFSLPPKIRILVLFLCGLAQQRLGEGKGTFSQKEVIEYFAQQGIPEGTIKVNLKLLRDDRLIVETQKSRYSTGYDKLSKIQEEFNRYAGKGN